MGGIGSGSYSRWNSKATTESTKRIDIRHMHKQGYLKPSTHGELSWTCGGKPSGNIRFIAYSRYLQLNYRFKQHDEEWQPVQQQIYYDYTPCHYGNSRQWFLCPKCHKRVAVLASDGPLFLCRHCYDLTYRSKNNNYIERLRDKRDSLGQRIFADFNGDYGCTKRKGMHQRTFDRLKEQYHQSDNHYHQAFENELFRLMQLP